MTRSRFALSIGVFLLTTAASASAQKNVSARTAVRAKAAPPVRALTEREANPSGPFAKLTTPQRDSIIENTRALLGLRYKWAGLTPERGLDCSGFVKYVFAKLGIVLPHSARMLARLGDAVDKDTAEMQPGDLLVFGKGRRISHVAIYVGDGHMIHAANRKQGVIETPVERYRAPGGLQWKGVRRVIAVDSTAADSIASPGDRTQPRRG